ncbi:MAG: 50S ribosomal protein L18 [bacterium]|nr:50S ribosomal protein L18 [bacterium]
MDIIDKKEKQYRRRQRIRAKISGTKTKPRLSVFKSNKHIFAQLIDDDKKKTMASASDLKMKKIKKAEAAFEVGKLIAGKAKELKIETVCFDRSGYKYHGRVMAVAKGAREGGLKF